MEQLYSCPKLQPDCTHKLHIFLRFKAARHVKCMCYSISLPYIFALFLASSWLTWVHGRVCFKRSVVYSQITRLRGAVERIFVREKNLLQTSATSTAAGTGSGNSQSGGPGRTRTSSSLSITPPVQLSSSAPATPPPVSPGPDHPSTTRPGAPPYKKGILKKPSSPIQISQQDLATSLWRHDCRPPSRAACLCQQQQLDYDHQQLPPQQELKEERKRSTSLGEGEAQNDAASVVYRKQLLVHDSRKRQLQKSGLALKKQSRPQSSMRSRTASLLPTASISSSTQLKTSSSNGPIIVTTV